MTSRKFKIVTSTVLVVLFFVFGSNINMLCACTNMNAGMLSNILKTPVPKESIDAATLQNIKLAVNKLLVSRSILDIAHNNCKEDKFHDLPPDMSIICHTPLRDLSDIRPNQVSPTNLAFQIALSSKLVWQHQLRFRLNMDNYIIQDVSVQYVRDPFWLITQYF